MSSSCQSLAVSLKSCILQSDCVVKRGLLPSQCLKDHINDLPEECQTLRIALYDCKRGMLDMRKRFRGNAAGPPANDTRLPPPTEQTSST